jgi:hypothetical protein
VVSLHGDSEQREQKEDYCPGKPQSKRHSKCVSSMATAHWPSLTCVIAEAGSFEADVRSIILASLRIHWHR